MTKIAKEKRILPVAQTKHTRALQDEQGNKSIEGYAAVFDQRSKLIWEWGEIFYEIIERNAFDDVLAADDLDVILTYQHNTNEPLARLNKRRGVQTLALEVDDYGLKFVASLNGTTEANDTWERVRSGDVFECSFIFTVEAAGQRWDKTEEGVPLRYISSVSGLYDVSVVVNGAYANTDLQAAERSYKEHQGEEEQEEEKPREPNDNYFDAMYEEIMGLECN